MIEKLKLHNETELWLEPDVTAQTVDVFLYDANFIEIPVNPILEFQQAPHITVVNQAISSVIPTEKNVNVIAFTVFPINPLTVNNLGSV